MHQFSKKYDVLVPQKLRNSLTEWFRTAASHLAVPHEVVMPPRIPPSPEWGKSAEIISLYTYPTYMWFVFLWLNNRFQIQIPPDFHYELFTQG